MARSIAAPASPSTLSGAARPLKGLARGVGYGLAGLAHAIGTGVRIVRAHRRLRIAAIAAAAVLAVAAAGWQLARHTSLTAVEQVQVSGLASTPGANSGQIEAALRGAARGMSTLGVSQSALRAAVARYPIVREVRARPKFPHGLRIEVVEQPPVAALIAGGDRTAVAANGVVLGPSYLSSSLPQVNAVATPAPGRRVTGGALLDELIVLGAAPGPLARDVTHVYMGSKGLTVVLHGGLEAYFGDATRPHAKWISLVRVLASPTSAGAAYIDVRLPERPAAGWAPGTTRPGAETSESETSGAATGEPATADPATAADLAAGLDAAVSGSTSTSTSPGAAAGTGAGTGTEAASSPGPGSTGGAEENEG